MKKIEEARLSEILPPNLMRDEKISALATTLDRMLSELTAARREVIHLPRLDELSGTILDLLMWQFHVDQAEPLWLSDEVKRNLIRESIAWHKIKGTRTAVEKINALFSREVQIQEYFEYGGEPFHFRLTTRPFKNESDYTTWMRQLRDAKNVRSWCDVVFEGTLNAQAYIGLGTWKHGRKRRKMSAEYEAGRVTTTIVDGTRTLIISSTQVIIRYGEEEEVIALGNLFGDVLKMRFALPKSDRILTIENPRENLTTEEIQVIADYATENEILLDTSKQSGQGELKRATLITTTTQILF